MKKLVSIILTLTLALALIAAPSLAESANTWYADTTEDGSEQYLWCLVPGVATREDGAQADAYMYMYFNKDGAFFLLYPDQESIPNNPMYNGSSEAFTNPAYFESGLGLSSEFEIAMLPNSVSWCMQGGMGGMPMDYILTMSLRATNGFYLSIPVLGWAGRTGEKWSLDFNLYGFASNFREVYDQVSPTWES